MMRSRPFAILLTLCALAAGCAGSVGGLTPSAAVTTAVQGWEQWLRVDWSAEGHEVEGYVYSKHGSALIDVQLLAQGLDEGGKVMTQKIVWVHGEVSGHQRAHFRIPAMPAGYRYRVSVWAFTVLESDSFR